MPPTMLLESLDGLRRKVKTLSVAYGVGVVAAAMTSTIRGTARRFSR